MPSLLLTAVLAVVTLLLTAAPARTAKAPKPVFSIDLKPDSRELEMSYQGRLLLNYVFSPHPFKPYVRELYTLEGVNVLRDAPADHLHHHALMYAIKVNGINFWEETPQAGYQQCGKEISRRIHKSAAGQPLAEFGHDVYWVASTNTPNPAAAALLVEHRTIRVTVSEKTKEVALEWKADFEVGPASPKVTLTGTVYHGLGVRFIEAFDKVARRQNSEGAAYTAEGKQDVTPAKWGSTSQSVRGKEITITLFNDPANAGEPRFFSMLNPFTYLSATQGLEQKPIEYGAGQKFSLRYLLTLHSEAQSAAALNRRYQQWLTP